METTTLLETQDVAVSGGKEDWTEVIRPQSGLLELRLREVWHYRDLLMLLVRREFVALYKQTILGPLWIFIQPILTSIIYVVIFGRIANLSSDGLPRLVFYLAGITCWSYFSACLNNTANTFITNANIFGKVYFPRIVMPLSVVISNLVRFLIQFGLLIAATAYYMVKGALISPNWYLLLLPGIVLLMAGLSQGFGMIISALTTKYRDLIFLLTFSVQLWMYGSPVIIPLSSVHGKLHLLMMLNPMTGIIEAFKYALLGTGFFSWKLLGYDTLCMIVVLTIGTIIFNKVEKNFMDTV